MDLHEAQSLALELMEKHGVTAAGWTFAFDNTKSRMGVCKYGPRLIAVSRLFAAHATESEVRDTILHEIAHVLAGPDAKHGILWKAHASRLGATPKACGHNPYVVREEALEANLAAVAGKPFYRVRAEGKHGRQRYRILDENTKSYKLVDEQGVLLRAAKELVYPEDAAPPSREDMLQKLRRQNLAAVAGKPVVRVAHRSYAGKRFAILRPAGAKGKNHTLVDLATGNTLRAPKSMVQQESGFERLGQLLVGAG
jgi:hypothetical protein